MSFLISREQSLLLESATIAVSEPVSQEASEKLKKMRSMLIRSAVLNESVIPNTERVWETINDYIGADEAQEAELSIRRSQMEEPYIIREGFYGAMFNKNGESLFLRMELLTEANADGWWRFKKMSFTAANGNRGVLSSLVSLAGRNGYGKYEDIMKVTGFTNEEYIAFTEKAINLKKKTDNKIVSLLKANSVGCDHMYTGSGLAQNYIVYVSKNPNFSIQNTGMTEDFVLKKFFNSYNDILITVGSDFSREDSFHNRGISRNPYWVFEEKYSGLSMLLHGFTGAVADKYFPKKQFMRVRPTGSMQCIIKKALLPGEGHICDGVKKIDITSLEVSPDDPEDQTDYISIAALKRIYLAHQG